MSTEHLDHLGNIHESRFIADIVTCETKINHLWMSLKYMQDNLSQSF